MGEAGAMSSNKRAPKLLIVCWVFFLFIPSVLKAETLFVHLIEKKTLLGERTEKVSTAYHRDGISIDRKKAYTGSFLKLFFGGVKEERETIFISLANNYIKEISWEEEKAYIYNINRLKEFAITGNKSSSEDYVPLMENRYQEFPPELRISHLQTEEVVNGYRCRKVEVYLKLNTYDRLRKTHSQTDVVQTLWLSDDVPGLKDRNEVLKRLGLLTGIEVERLGSLSFVLSYWKGSLAPISHEIETVKGYPVKSHAVVTAHFIPPEGESKKVSRVINEEVSSLVAVYDRIDEALFTVPSNFKEIEVR